MQVYGLQWDSAAGVFPSRSRLSALYVNGEFAARPVKYRRGLVWIDVTGDAPDAAFWLDVERGDAAPKDVPGWLDARERSGAGPGGIYCDRSALPEVEAHAGDRPHSLWVATLDGTAEVTVPSGAGRVVAIQDYPASMTGLDADLSIVVDRDYWLGHALP